ncbi:MAG: PilZ domain-containing protein [Nitrospira sp.]|nr:PilZ domain-containing protein [Nitrospira sp.]TKB74665.1 MAG: PilZ domain-containing protein [Nitrospira sp.]
MIGRRRIDTQATIPSTGQITERRAARRVPVQIKARFSATEYLQQVGDGLVLDLSESGCKLRSAQVSSLEHFLALYLTIPETSRLIPISEARVIWTTRDEYGIEFRRVTKRERARLRHFVWKQVNHSTLKGSPPLHTIQSHPFPSGPQLNSMS